MAKKLKILIADDHEMIRKGLILMFKSQQKIEFEIIEAKDGLEAFELYKLNPKLDAIILDISMPNLDGIACLKQIRKLDKEVPILIISMHKEEKIISNALENGASGYLLKNSSLEEIIKGIVKVVKKKRYLSNEVEKLLISKNTSKSPIVNQHGLTNREIQIISMIIQEKTSQEIGDYLFISKRTVEGHRNNIMEKIGVKSTIGIIKYAIENGID